MTIKVGDAMPDGQLQEYVEAATGTCAAGPVSVQVAPALAGKRVVIFGLPGAFTPTCSAQHAPGYIAEAEALKARGIDEIWCLSVNDAFVMGAWGRELGAAGKVRMMADGSGTYTHALGLELDLTDAGLGVRCDRFSMLVEDGVLKTLNLEKGGGLEVSDAASMLAAL